MSSFDTVARSVELDPKTGEPVDKSLVWAGSDRRSPPAEFMIPEPAPNLPPAAEVPSDRFDPAQFAASLPKTETAKLASMSDAMPAGSGVKRVERTKPKVSYLGRRLDPVKYELDVPFVIDDVAIHEVTVSSPTGAMFEEFQGIVVTHGSEVAVFWLCLGGLSPDTVEAIHEFDKLELNDVCFPFLPRLMQRQIQEAAAERARERTEASSTTSEAAPA